MSISSFVIETSQVTRSNLGSFLKILDGCWKASSLIWMQSSGLSVLPGVILSGWTKGAELAVAQFSRERRFAEFLIRIEKPKQRWTNQRGGYLVPISSVPSLVEELGQQDVLTLLLEPAGPYSDLYSLTAVCDLYTGATDLEIVGPGFDASDILRGDITPHERFHFTAGSGTKPRVTRTYLVESNAYRASVQRRLIKIGTSIRNPSLPREVTGIRKEELAEEALQRLRKTGQNLLLDHLDRYEPVPAGLLSQFLHELQRLLYAVRSAPVPWKTLSAAGSFLSEARLVMWDFFAPDSYDTQLLSEITASS